MSIGNKLLSLRKQKGISQQELADYLHVTRQTISKFEHDLSLPDMDMMLKISEYYQVTLNELLEIDDSSEDKATDLYQQIQIISQNIMKNNKRMKLMNMIFMIVCIFSLLLSSFTMIKLKKYDDMMDNNEEENLLEEKYINFLDYNHPLFVRDNHKTFMEIDLFDLDHEQVQVNYQFTLKEYTEKTTVDIDFCFMNEHYCYGLKKIDSGKYAFKDSIPLLNYDEVNLKIKDEQGKIITENIGFNDNCCYLKYVASQIACIYIPVNKGQLLNNQLIFDPYEKRDINDIEGNLNGTLSVQLYSSSDKNYCYFNQEFSLSQKKEIQLKKNLPLNQDIYIDAKIHLKMKNLETEYDLCEDDSYGDRNTLFRIEDNHQKYIIIPR